MPSPRLKQLISGHNSLIFGFLYRLVLQPPSTACALLLLPVCLFRCSHPFSLFPFRLFQRCRTLFLFTFHSSAPSPPPSPSSRLFSALHPIGRDQSHPQLLSTLDRCSPLSQACSAETVPTLRPFFGRSIVKSFETLGHLVVILLHPHFRVDSTVVSPATTPTSTTFVLVGRTQPPSPLTHPSSAAGSTLTHTPTLIPSASILAALRHTVCTESSSLPS